MTEATRIDNVLSLRAVNSSRSIMTEAILDRKGDDRPKVAEA